MAIRLGAVSLGFLNNRPLKRALVSAGYDIRFGPTARNLDGVAVWGDRPVAARAKSFAAWRKLPPIFIEDAFLRSVSPDSPAPPLGLTIDHRGLYSDASQPSDLENLLNAAQPSIADNLAFAEYLETGVSKYNHAREQPAFLKHEDYVLVADQRVGDASIRLGAANANSFAKCLQAALDENPKSKVYLKSHPRGLGGHFNITALPDRVSVLPPGIDPIFCIKMAQVVYCVTSQIGFEAILRGTPTRVFGLPFYANWGLTSDEQTLPRRQKNLDIETLFRTVMQDYCYWFDPIDGSKIDFVSALRILDAQAQHTRKTQNIAFAEGFKPWKRKFVRRLLPGVRFQRPSNNWIPDDKRAETVVWASHPKSLADTSREGGERFEWRMEDGFLRSKGLGAALVPPWSLVFDDLGIYYDPNRPNRLHLLIEQRKTLSAAERRRAQGILDRLKNQSMSKYNLSSAADLDFPDSVGKKVILVPGQVEDDQSILKGAGKVRTNQGLLNTVRAHNPDAFIAYKPHPDVEAGLRKGELQTPSVADIILTNIGPVAAIDIADEVWTMTSLLGFEAILRGIKTVCLGRPFYSGWGLTFGSDRQIDASRGEISLLGLIHATLIDYPTYFDPQSGSVSSVERTIAHLSNEETKNSGFGLSFQKLQHRLRKSFSR